MATKNYFELEFCPVYRPTEVEWKTPLRYISSLDKTTGICKIIPPTKFKSNLDLKPFKTRNQVLQELDGKSRLSNFIGNSLYKFHLNQGRIFKVPSINRVNLNIKLLFELKNGTDLYFKQKCMEFGLDQSHYTVLKRLYQKWILPFKEWVKETGLKFNLIDDSGSPVSACYTIADLDCPEDLNASETPKPLRKSTRPASHPIVYKHTGIRGINLPPKVFEAKGSEVCKSCSKSGFAAGLDTTIPNPIIICDDCESAYHITCLPIYSALDKIPTHEWTCASCILNTDVDFGFLDNSRPRTLPEFEKFANDFKSRQFHTKTSPYQIEQSFWALVSTPFGNTSVEYGADLNSAIIGSGFRGFNHPSNLNRIASLNDSLLKHVKIDGVVVPWVYVGMLYSTFCWHIEDHYTYSINYNHAGDVKTWYSIPTKDSKNFEQVMMEENEILFKRDPDLLFHLTTMLSPGLLKKRGVDVRMCYQEAGEFVVTFPRAYHSGFNQGFNIAEAVNFATSDWLPYGKESVDLYRNFKRAPVFSHDYLIIQTALEENVNLAIDCSKALEELRSGLQNDLFGRRYETGIYNDDQCTECKFYCYLGSIKCLTHKVLCFKHECECEDRQVVVYWSLKQLEDLQKKIDVVADSVATWLQGYSGMTKPSVEEMRLALEKAGSIRYTGSEVFELERKLEKCVEWENCYSAFTKLERKKSLHEYDCLLNAGISLGFFSEFLEEAISKSRSAVVYNDLVLKQISDCYLDPKKLNSLFDTVSEYQIVIPSLDEVKYTLEKSRFMEKYFNVEEFGNYSWSEVEEIYQASIDYDLKELSTRLSVSILRGQSLARKIETYVNSGQVIDFGVLESFIKERRVVPIPDNAQALIDWLFGARNWSIRAHKVLNPTPNERKTQSFRADMLMKEYFECFEKLYLREAVILQEELQKTLHWKENLSLLLVGQKSISLPECIKQLKESLSLACNASHERPCICKGSMGSIMIQCIDCQKYYHHHCLKIPKNFNADQFQCPVCDINLGYNPFQKPSFQVFSALVFDSYYLTIFPEYGEEFQDIILTLNQLLLTIDKAIDSCTKICDARDLLRIIYGLFVVTDQNLRLEVSLYVPKCQICDGKDEPETMVKCLKCNRFAHSRCCPNVVQGLAKYQCPICHRKRELDYAFL